MFIKGTRYRVLYDFEPENDYELYFNEGDVIFNVQVVDELWMEGTVERTGRHGLFPSNYIEAIS